MSMMSEKKLKGFARGESDCCIWLTLLSCQLIVVESIFSKYIDDD